MTLGIYVNPHMRTTSLCKNKWSEICFFGHFCIWGSPYANFLCAKCVQIPICESPYANKYCSNTPKTNFLCIWDLHTHNEVVRIQGLTYIYIGLGPGAHLGGSLCHTHNLTLRLFSRTCLHTRSLRRPDETAQKEQTTWQTTSPWCWSRSPLQRRGFDEPMPPEGWAALRMFVPMPPSKQLTRFNKFKEKLIYFYWSLVDWNRARPPATMVAETASIVGGGGQ